MTLDTEWQVRYYDDVPLTCDECTRPLDDLVSKKRHFEAGQVLLDYTKDVRQAVIAFVEGNSFSEARRVVSNFETIYLDFP